MNKFFSLVKKYYTNIWIRNGILIAIALIFSLLGNSFQPINIREKTFSLGILTLFNIGLIFFYNHIILRLFLFQKRIFLFLLLFVGYMAVLTLFIMYGSPYILNKPFKTDYMRLLPDVIFNTILISLFYFFHYYFLKYITLQDIKLLNQKIEIENLKQQLNPHFLLNSLNNLYAVSLSKPTEVPNKIIELSDLLKYQIEASNKEYNTLEIEKEFIKKYIAYSQWKLQNIKITNVEIGEQKNYKITPMLFLPLVENAIKYSNFDKNPLISIYWNFNPTKFTFTIINNFTDNRNVLFSTKTGLKNLRKRLELFHADSNLQVEEKGNSYKVILSIWNLNIHA